MITWSRTNEELQPICDALSFTPENRVLSVTGGGCVPLVAASFGSDVVMVDLKMEQITYALKRIQDVTRGDLASVLSVYDGTEKVDTPNTTYLKERLKESKLGVAQAKQTCVFTEWHQNMNIYDRVYLSNVLTAIPTEIGKKWKLAPKGTLVYTSSLGCFDGPLQVAGLQPAFSRFFEIDWEKTRIAIERKVDTFWNPVVYRKR